MNKLEGASLEYYCLLRSSDLFAKDGDIAMSIGCAIKAISILPQEKAAYERVFLRTSGLRPEIAVKIIKNNLKTLSAADNMLIEFSAKLLNAQLFAESIDFLSECLKYLPQNAAMHNNLAIAYKRAGLLEESKKLLLRAVSIIPKYPFFYTNLASIAKMQKDSKAAALYLQKAVALKPDDITARINLIESLKDIRELNAALAVANETVKIFPNSYDAQLALGNFFASLKAYDKAIEPYKRAIDIDGSKTQAYNNIGVSYKEIGENEQALKAYEKVLSINPDDPATHNNMGNLLRNIGRIEDALSHLQKSIEINPKYPDAYSNIGAIYKEQKDYEKAIAFYQKAIELEPHHTNANFDVSLIKLSEGDYKEGWEKYEYRLKMAELIAKTYRYKTPLWQGESLDGKTIILQNEQGYGDNIMFARYVKNFKDLGATVLMRTRDSLVELFRSIDGIDGVYSEDADIPPHDFYLPLLSSPKMFGTTIDNIPQNLLYVSASKPFSQKFDSKKLNVGLVWSSSRTNKDFKNKYLGLEALKSLFDLKNVIFYSLQVGDDADEIKKLGLENKIRDLSKELDNFSKTASAIEALDIVVTMDTAVAHLCGAMNKKAFVLVPRPADWRWMQDGDSTPWYPSLKLFRQSKKGEWNLPVAEVKKALARLTK